MKMKKSSKRRLLLNYFTSFAGFFLLSGFTTSVSFFLFLNTMHLKLSVNLLKVAAPITFYNLLFVSAVFALISTIISKLTIEKPINEIDKVLLKIRKGDFSAHFDRKFYTSRYSTIVSIINLITQELSSLEGLKVSLMSNVSHELKTPMSVINNYATLLQDPNLSPAKRKEYANAISESSRKMTELITNILKLNQLENQSIPSDVTEFNLSEQICECLLEFEEIWENKNIEIETDIAEDVTVLSNIQLMGIVWNNLFSNAFKFTPEGGKVYVSLTQDKKYAIVEISDTGCGIPEDQTELIFEKFYQCDTSRSTDGNGLGLALVKRILNITDSHIAVESKLGKGTKSLQLSSKNSNKAPLHYHSEEGLCTFFLIKF